ncbi:MAG: orotate phosphoribosyltransferase [Chloroflexi bacterium]|nr:orotate phosphoribosyltransferase [Chloroflexota bacterium]
MTSPVQKIFEDAGALLSGHFLLTSGRHSAIYWEKFRVIEQPEATMQLCSMIVKHFQGESIQVVAGPTTGGVVLAYEVARQLRVRCAFAEKDTQGRSFRRGIQISPGERMLIVDDILTTGLSLREVVRAADKASASIVGIAVLVDRSDEGVDLGYPLFSCLRSPATSYPAMDCPLCHEGKPLVRPGGA